MKFRAKLDDIVNIGRLSDIVTTLSKGVKMCVLRLSPSKMCFVISGKGSMNMWCELNQSTFFSEYRIEGRDEQNEIYLEVNVEQLSRTLRHSHTNALSVKIKLTKRDGAYLSIDVIQATISGGERCISHEVPVSVVPQRLWNDYQEPDMPDIDVSIYLPPLKQLKTIIDRMKTMDNYITVLANMSGQLQIKLETDSVTAITYFSNLTNHDFGKEDSDPTTLYEARVDIRKLSQVLNGHFNPVKVICNIIDGCGLQLFLLHKDVSLQYYIPAMSL